MSPDGSAPIDIKPRISADDLKLPEGRRKRPREPEAKAVPESKTFKCSQPNCEAGSVLMTNNELLEHQKWHERERQRQAEEEERNKKKREDPLQYIKVAAREGLGLGDDGKPKEKEGDLATIDVTPSKTAGTTPQVKPGSTPLLGNNTPINMKSEFTPLPSGKSPAPPTFRTPQLSHAKTPGSAGGKSTSGIKTTSGEDRQHPNHQIPTPPSNSAWEASPMSPDVLRHCFDGLLEQTSGLSALPHSIFTPAYTPSSSDAEGGDMILENVASSYEDWNPFGYKESLGEGFLEDMEWDGVPTAVLGKNWATDCGFTLNAGV